jgi:secreted trypsin-like serine protease
MYADGNIVSEKTINIRIGTGKLISTSFKQYNVKLLIVHEDYDQTTFEHDIALMKLKETLDLSENFRAICFSQLGNLPHASTGVAVGYGSTDKTKETVHSEVLRQVDMPIVDKEICYDSDFEFFNKHLFPGNFCAGELNVMKGVSITRMNLKS